MNLGFPGSDLGNPYRLNRPGFVVVVVVVVAVVVVVVAVVEVVVVVFWGIGYGVEGLGVRKP